MANEAALLSAASGLAGGEEAVRISQSGLLRERILVRLVRLGCRIELTGDRGDTLTLGLLTGLHTKLIVITLLSINNNRHT